MPMFYPMFAMVLLTFAVVLYLVILRFNAVRQRRVPISYFRLNSGPVEPPARAVAASNHYNNLFQMPLLFYVTCLLAMVMNLQGPLLVMIAWIFVGARVLHALIHLTYNNVIHRMLAFAVSVCAVLAMWIIIALTVS